MTLHVVGDGKHRPELERLASVVGVRDSIEFLGRLPAGAAVREQLDRSDLFVLASRSEGLPRAMVEAMARSLPCIGSTVGGIPELLAAEDLVQPGDPAALSAKIREVLASPSRLSAMSARNLRKAQDYRDGILAERRIAFFDHIRRTTSEWLQDAGLTQSPETAEVVGGR
jgi:glycosyltransferase involved in cell wall biosynthesis